MQLRQVAETGVPAEQLIPAGSHQRHRQPRLAHRLGHVKGIEPVEGRLIQRVQSTIDVVDEHRFGEKDLAVVAADGLRDRPGALPFAQLALFERERESVDRLIRCLLRQVGDGGGIDPAGEEHAQRHIAGQMQAHRFEKLGAKRLFADGRLVRGALLDAPESARTRRLSSPVKHAQFPRPDHLDPADDCPRADDEAVPHDRRQRMRIQPRRCEQPGRENGAHFGGQQQRPFAPRVGIGGDVQRLDTQRVARHRERARARVPQREGEHAAELFHRVDAVSREEPKHDGRIAGRVELLAGRGELLPQRHVVVNLAVEDDDLPGDRIGHRLGCGGGEVEDGEPPVREHAAEAVGIGLAHPGAARVRAAVGQGTFHPSQGIVIARSDATDDAFDATHFKKEKTRVKTTTRARWIGTALRVFSPR